MADDKSKPADAESKGALKTKLVPIAIVASLMLLEGAGVFFATRYMSSGPLNANAEAVGSEDQAEPESKGVEIPVVDLTAPNRKTGRIFVYEIQVAARVAEVDKEKVEELIGRQRLTIEDRFTNIVRSATPEVLQEDGLETLRRQFRAELNKVFNDENLVQEVLFPRMMPHRADY